MKPEDIHSKEFIQAVEEQFAPKERDVFLRDKWTIPLITEDLLTFFNHETLRSVTVQKALPTDLEDENKPCLAFSNMNPIRIPVFNASAVTKHGIDCKDFISNIPGTDIPVLNPPKPNCCCQSLKNNPSFKNFCINKPGDLLDGHLRTMNMKVLPLFADIVARKIPGHPLVEELGLAGTSITTTDVRQRLTRLSEDLGNHGLNYVPPTKLHADTIYCHICNSLIQTLQEKDYTDGRDMGPWVIAVLREVRINFMQLTGDATFFSNHQTIKDFKTFAKYFAQQHAAKKDPDFTCEVHSPMEEPLMKLICRIMFAPTDGLIAVSSCDKMSKNAAVACIYGSALLVVSALYPSRTDMEKYVIPLAKTSPDPREDLWDDQHIVADTEHTMQTDRKSNAFFKFRKKS